MTEEKQWTLVEAIAKALAYRSVGDPHAVDVKGNQRWTWFLEDAGKFVEIFGYKLKHFDAPPAAPGLPDDIAERLLTVGRVEWGTSLYQTDEEHVEDYRNTLRITREHFATEAEETAIHGVYLDGTNTVLAHTGNSPNSPQHARILVGAWNQLVDMALAAREAGR